MIVDPVTLPAGAPVAAALSIMETYRISGVPITDEDGRLVGILTNRDLRFEDDTSRPVSDLMTSTRPRHRAGRHDAGAGARRPPHAQDREAPGRRPRTVA